MIIIMFLSLSFLCLFLISSILSFRLGIFSNQSSFLPDVALDTPKIILKVLLYSASISFSIVLLPFSISIQLYSNIDLIKLCQRIILVLKLYSNIIFLRILALFSTFSLTYLICKSKLISSSKVIPRYLQLETIGILSIWVS